MTVEEEGNGFTSALLHADNRLEVYTTRFI